jgi:rare lipoprotein A
LQFFFLKTMLRFIVPAFVALGALAPFAAEAASSCGYASYYGPGFHGRTTANGERFNSWAMTAAHKSLPFGTKLRVTNQSNSKSITIRVNDDGPHIPGRIIDLSEGAFSMIANTSTGVVPVCYQIIG